MAGHEQKYVERVIEISGASAACPTAPPKCLLRRPWHVAQVRRRRPQLGRIRSGAPGDQGFSVFGFAKVLARVLAVRCVARRGVTSGTTSNPHGPRECDIEGHGARSIFSNDFDVVLVHSATISAPIATTFRTRFTESTTRR